MIEPVLTLEETAESPPVVQWLCTKAVPPVGAMTLETYHDITAMEQEDETLSVHRWLKGREMESAMKECQPPQSKASLMLVAPELHLMIISHLAPIDRASLRMTNRYFHATVPSLKAKELPRIERQINHSHSYPRVLCCTYCKRVRPLKHFADNMYEVTELKSKKRKGVFRIQPIKIPVPGCYGSVGTDFYCIDCAIKQQRSGYNPGDIMIVGKQYHVVCTWCNCNGRLATIECPGICGLCADAAYRVLVKKDKTLRLVPEVWTGIGKLQRTMYTTAVKVHIHTPYPPSKCTSL